MTIPLTRQIDACLGNLPRVTRDPFQFHEKIISCSDMRAWELDDRLQRTEGDSKWHSKLGAEPMN